MATIADFRGQAEAENQGWLASARTAADKSVTDYSNQFSQIDPYYSSLADELGVQQNKAQNALTASMIKRGVGRSGVMTNAESNLASTYGKLQSKLGEEKRQKTTELQSALDTAKSQRANVDVEYQSKVDQLARELYNAWKTQEDQRIYNQQQLALSKANSSYSNPSSGGTMSKAGIDNLLKNQLYSDLADPSTHVPYRRENVMSSLASKYPELSDYIWSKGYQVYTDNWANPAPAKAATAGTAVKRNTDSLGNPIGASGGASYGMTR